MNHRIDAHQHFWRIGQIDYGWLRPDVPGLQPLYRDFLPADLEPGMAAHGIGQTVLVQAAACEAETDVLLEFATAHPWIAGVVGWVDLGSEAAIDSLSRWAGHPAFKGVRPMLQDLPADDWIANAPHPRVVSSLVALGLRFDALVRPRQLAGLLAFVRRHPTLPVVIDHAAKPPIGDPARSQETAAWRQHMAALAAEPQVMCKFSGLLSETAALPDESLDQTIEKIRPIWNDLMEWFGPSRLVWGSDWPVLKLNTDLARWVAVSEALIGSLTPAEQRMVWHDNACSFYGIKPLANPPARALPEPLRNDARAERSVTSPPTPLIAISGLCKSFAGVKALDQCQLDLLPGEVHALMGENGAGKSTLMKVLAGVHARDAGEILVDGRAVEIDSPRQAQALGIGIVHQELNLMRHLTAAQNIFIGREPRKAGGLLLDEDALNANAQRIFARMNLNLDPRTPVSELPVARQQMVEIAKALSFDSRVLIMDEPTAALNDTEVADLFRLIRQLKAQGVGLVYISHKMDELRQIADRVTVMRDGRYIATVPMAGTSVEQIVSMMVGRQLEGTVRRPPDTRRNPVALEVRGLNRGRAVRDVSFTLRRGEILGFAGLMGAGRTEV
ncbi:MAG: ABC-type sugar transport system, ATPase component protein, partial [Rhodoferax sp.]|nr:ABC-type sugar transport system, ATPase component protein [Rhodoferax sp.]